MGDRCVAWFTCRKSDLSKFEDEFGRYMDDRQDLDNNPDLTHIILYDVNYGGVEEFELIQAPFYGGHGSGGSYPECCFVSDGTTYLDCPAENGTPVVPIPESMIIDPKEMEIINNYYTILRKVKHIFGV